MPYQHRASICSHEGETLALEADRRRYAEIQSSGDVAAHRGELA